MRESQLELDFVAWLGELSADVPAPSSQHWFENEDGGTDDDEFCEDCAEPERDRRDWSNRFALQSHDDGEIELPEPYDDLHSDGGSALEQDHSPSCAECGCHLLCSPSEYCIEQDIEWLEEATAMDASNAVVIREWLTGMGAYQQEKHWPLVEPHAIRLMRAVDRRIVSDGWLAFCPADALEMYEKGSWRHPWSSCDSVWLGIYQWFARRLVKWSNGKPHGVLQFLNNTSSVNNGTFDSVDGERACANVRDLISNLGRDNERSEFLAYCGIEANDDLFKPITIRDERCDWPPFDVRGWRFKGSPNECHPEARTITYAALVFSAWNLRWEYRLFYDYNHYSRSSWHKSIVQTRSERLPAFMERVGAWIDEIVEPRDMDDRFRSDRLTKWDETRAAVRSLFYFDCDEHQDVELTDLLRTIDGGAMAEGRITIDDKHQGRLETLKQWIAEDVAQKKAKHDEWEAERRARQW